MQQLKGLGSTFLRSTQTTTHSGTASRSRSRCTARWNLFARMFLPNGTFTFWAKTRTASILLRALALQWCRWFAHRIRMVPEPGRSYPATPGVEVPPAPLATPTTSTRSTAHAAARNHPGQPERPDHFCSAWKPCSSKEAHHQQHQRVCPAVLQPRRFFIAGQDDNARLPAFLNTPLPACCRRGDP